MWIYDSADNTVHLWASTSPRAGDEAYCEHIYNPATASKAGSANSKGKCPTCFANAKAEGVQNP